MGEQCRSRCYEEACVPGSRCPNGNICPASAVPALGRCPLQIRPPVCAGKKCAAGQVCCWSSTHSRGACAERCGDDVDYVFGCTGPEQCTPYDCNIPYTGSPKVYSCGGEGFVSSVICETLKDCPKHLGSLGSGPTSPTAISCTHDSDLPPGIKTCDYE